mgnify:FL=1
MENIKDWESIKSVIKIERIVNRGKNKLSKEISYFISSLSSDNKPSFFSKGIRNHWSIENGLHYVKDVTFREDASKIKTGNAPENMSLFRNISINIFKKQKLNNISQAIRLVSNDINKMWEFIIE